MVRQEEKVECIFSSSPPLSLLLFLIFWWSQVRQSVFYSLTQATPKYGSWVGMDRQKEEGKHIFSFSSSSSSQDQGFKPLYSYTCYCTDCQTLVKCIFFHPHFPYTLFLFLLLLQPFLFLGETSGVYLPTCLSLIPLVFRLPNTRRCWSTSCPPLPFYSSSCSYSSLSGISARRDNQCLPRHLLHPNWPYIQSR